MQKKQDDNRFDGFAFFPASQKTSASVLSVTTNTETDTTTWTERTAADARGALHRQTTDFQKGSLPRRQDDEIVKI